MMMMMGLYVHVKAKNILLFSILILLCSISGYTPKRQYLLPNAVPSQFVFTKEETESSMERAERAEERTTKRARLEEARASNEAEMASRESFCSASTDALDLCAEICLEI